MMKLDEHEERTVWSLLPAAILVEHGPLLLKEKTHKSKITRDEMYSVFY